jgi:hypothetical protein
VRTAPCAVRNAKQLRPDRNSRGCFVSEEIMVRWRTLDEVLCEYHSFLVSSAALELIEALRRRLETQVTDAEYWRGVAKQAQREAERKTFRSRQIMLTLARTYDQLTDAAEKEKPLRDEPSG